MSNIMIVFNYRADTPIDLLNPGGDFPFFHIRFQALLSLTHCSSDWRYLGSSSFNIKYINSDCTTLSRLPIYYLAGLCRTDEIAFPVDLL